MELPLVLVLALVNVVIATPHGYGVKGGATAKAEASAVAGALGPVPLSIPSGSAYSGSFSKSSSSSFASSSASSSSSSYSFSGSGINGFPGIGAGGAVSKGPCPGNCPGGVGGSLNGGQQFAGANAVAAADAKALSGAYAPCQGSNCNGSPSEKCSNGQCPVAPGSKDQNKCTTGNCGPNSQKPSSESGSSIECSSGNCDTEKEDGGQHDSNDFAVNINRNSNQNQQSKSSQDLDSQHTNKDRLTGIDCSGGKCGPATFNPSNEGSNQKQHPVPATYLTTPNLNEPCTSSNCNSPSQNNGPSTTGGLPSSYNVPLHSATNPPSTLYSPSGNSFEPGKQTYPNKAEPGVPCTSPNCNSDSYNAATYNRPNDHIGQQQPGYQEPCVSGQCDNHSSLNVRPSNYGAAPGYQEPCVSGQCDINSSLNVKPSNYGAAPGITSPNYLHGSYSSNVPSGNLAQQGCNGPSCAKHPSNQPKYTIPGYASLPASPQDNKCGPLGCADTSHSDIPSKPNNADAPGYSGSFGGPSGFLGANHAGSNIPENSGQYSHFGPTETPVSSGPSGASGSPSSHGSFETTKPNPANHYKPAHSSTSIPTQNYGSSPVHGSFGISSQNELPSNDHYGQSHSPSTVGTTGTFGYNKPSSLPATPTTHPSYTGSIGTSGTNIPLGSATQPDSSNLNKPSTNFLTGSSPSYANSAGASNTGSNFIHGSSGASNTGTTLSSQSSPTYTGAFGGPTGGIDSSSLPSTGTLKPGSGNCGLGGCYGAPDGNTNAGTTSGEKPSGVTSSQKKPYTGGFGGPTGILKPNEFNVPSNVPTASSGNSPCNTGNCVPKDTTSTSHGNGYSIAGTQSVASATASANAVAYSGGFGGPPGFLKPFDDGKVSGSAHGNLGSKYSPSFDASHPEAIGQQSGNDKNEKPSISLSGGNPAAHASASASAVAGSYGGINNNQNGGSSGCNNGCPSHGSNGDGSNNGHPNGAGAGSVASAKSVAGANSFGFGGSFASSSASAHASAGAATKGGYGRK